MYGYHNRYCKPYACSRYLRNDFRFGRRFTTTEITFRLPYIATIKTACSARSSPSSATHTMMVKSRASFTALTCLFRDGRRSLPDRQLSTVLEPVKMSYTSYESATDDGPHQLMPIIIMHGLFGCKSNWNSLSKTLHNMTRRKVRAARRPVKWDV